MKTCTFNPETHAVVPIEPVKAMLDRHFSELDIEADDVYQHQYELATSCFKAMVASAPEYPADAVKPCIDELISSVKSLVACKGRFHTQQNFERLALAYKNFEAGNSASAIRYSDLAMSFIGMTLCETCGNKRCPHATDKKFACTGSNEPGQVGSAYSLPPALEGV